MKTFKKVADIIFYCYDSEIDKTIRIIAISPSIEFIVGKMGLWECNDDCTEEEFKKAWAYTQSEIILKYHQLFLKQNAFIEMVSGGNEE